MKDIIIFEQLVIAPLMNGKSNTVQMQRNSTNSNNELSQYEAGFEANPIEVMMIDTSREILRLGVVAVNGEGKRLPTWFQIGFFKNS